MPFFDTVSREMYDREKDRADRLQTQVEKLTADILRLKRKGYELQGDVKPGRVVPSGPTPEEAAAIRMHDGIVEKLAKDIENMPGVSPEAAKAEAQRLRAAISSGSFGEPPL